MKMFLIGGLAVLLAAPATAQTSNCQWLGQIWTCNQQPQVQQSPGVDWRILQQQSPSNNPYEAFQRGQEARQRAEAEARAQRADQQAASDAQNSRALRAAVGGLVAEGQCAKAADLAVQQGDFELAEQAHRYCTAQAKAQ